MSFHPSPVSRVDCLLGIFFPSPQGGGVDGSSVINLRLWFQSENGAMSDDAALAAERSAVHHSAVLNWDMGIFVSSVPLS